VDAREREREQEQDARDKGTFVLDRTGGKKMKSEMRRDREV
jgi:hypothetical protein